VSASADQRHPEARGDAAVVAVIGVGLIGGSIGLAARERLGAEVRGHDPDRGALEAAARLGVIDVACDALEDALDGADVAFVAAPVGTLPHVVDAVLAHAPPGCVVTDAGSVKRGVVSGRDDERFVGGHPLAGAETAGVEHARADLFDGATWYLTPTEGTSGVLYDRLQRTIAGLGARPTAIDAGEHDLLMATVSHLPHVLANVLVTEAAQALGRAGDGRERLPATGPSFRDATRVAGANTAIWTDIYLANRDALMRRIDDAVTRLGEVRAALERGDASAIAEWNDGAREDRRRLLEVGIAGGPVHELRVSLPNRPGVVAQVALELGRAAVNIEDMALYPAADMTSGVIALFVRGDDDARRAEELVAGLDFPVVRA
jgi:prephenate dehydrogenase